MNQRLFAGSNLLPQRDLIAGSRYILRLTYDTRLGDDHRILQNAFEAASVPGDSVEIEFKTLLDYQAKTTPVVSTAAKANAGSRVFQAAVSGEAIEQGSLFSVAGEIYRVRQSVAIGASQTILVGWPLRNDIANNTSLEFENPTGEFVVIRDPPVFPIRKYKYEDEGYTQGGPIVVELMEAQ